MPESNDGGALEPDLKQLVCLDLDIRELSENQLKLVAQAEWYYAGGTVVVPGPQINWMTTTSPESIGIDVHSRKLELVGYKYKLVMLSEALDEVARQKRAEQERKIKVRNKWNTFLSICVMVLLFAMLLSGSDAQEGSIASVLARVVRFLLLGGFLVSLSVLFAMNIIEKPLEAWATPAAALIALICAAKWAFEITWTAAITYVSAGATGLLFAFLLGRMAKRLG